MPRPRAVWCNGEAGNEEEEDIGQPWQPVSSDGARSRGASTAFTFALPQLLSSSDDEAAAGKTRSNGALHVAFEELATQLVAAHQQQVRSLESRIENLTGGKCASGGMVKEESNNNSSGAAAALRSQSHDADENKSVASAASDSRVEGLLLSGLAGADADPDEAGFGSAQELPFVQELSSVKGKRSIPANDRRARVSEALPSTVDVARRVSTDGDDPEEGATVSRTSATRRRTTVHGDPKKRLSKEVCMQIQDSIKVALNSKGLRGSALAYGDGMDAAETNRTDRGSMGSCNNQSRQTPVRVIGNIKLDEHFTNLEEFFHGRFEILMSFVIIANACTIFADFQFAGSKIGVEIGVTRQTEVWEEAETAFFWIDHIFQIVYMLEALARILCFRRSFFYDFDLKSWEKYNMFDLWIVFVGCLDQYIFPFLGVLTSKLSFLRLVRLARLARTLRAVRKMKRFAKVRVLLGTVASSWAALSWSLLFLFILMFLASCFVTQHLQFFMKDPESRALIDVDMQQELWELYGTSSRSFWTMFQITLGAQGTMPTQQLIHVHWSFVVFVLLYVSGVVFAVICIIQALFLKDTLEVAANDAEVSVLEGLQKRSDTVQKLEQVFLAADISGDGIVSLEEFEDVIAIPEVKGYLDNLGLDITEAKVLFNILGDGENEVDYNEFVEGVMRLKGQARSMDVIALMRDVKRVLVQLGDLRDCLGLGSMVSCAASHGAVNMGAGNVGSVNSHRERLFA